MSAGGNETGIAAIKIPDNEAQVLPVRIQSTAENTANNYSMKVNLDGGGWTRPIEILYEVYVRFVEDYIL
ncbi:MAG TPA: hypothetical protein VGF44_01050 [Terriglobales bacterium]|jgi:hypothetical protein